MDDLRQLPAMSLVPSASGCCGPPSPTAPPVPRRHRAGAWAARTGAAGGLSRRVPIAVLCFANSCTRPRAQAEAQREAGRRPLPPGVTPEGQRCQAPSHAQPPSGAAGSGDRRRGRGSQRLSAALTSPRLALPDQEGPAVVARLEQQLLRLLSADALVQPPARAAGAGRACPGCAGTPRVPGPILPRPGQRSQLGEQRRVSWGHPGAPRSLPGPQRCSSARGRNGAGGAGRAARRWPRSALG